jgi:acyl-CoA dehydrogenase
MTYAAPLDDMRFVLNHLAGLPAIATIPGRRIQGRNLSRRS